MILLDDRERWLNLNFAEIYVLLSGSEYDTLHSRVEALNGNPAVRRGLFNITPVRRGEEMNRVLPEDIREVLADYNVIVRLVDSIHGTYTYGISKFNTQADDAAWASAFEGFTMMVCQKNISQLDILKSRSTATAIGAQQLYESMNLRHDVFDQALNGTLSEEENFRFAESNDVMRVSDAACSQEVIESAVDAAKQDVISQLRCRPTGDERGQLMVRVHVEKNRVHFEFKLGDRVADVVFKGHSEDFLYAAVLKSVTDNYCFTPRDFGYTRNNRVIEDKSIIDRLQALHESLGYNHFSEEKEKMRGDRRNEAKSNINKALRKGLNGLSSSAFNICEVKLKEPRTKRSEYSVGILKENIHWDLPHRTTMVLDGNSRALQG